MIDSFVVKTALHPDRFYTNGQFQQAWFDKAVAIIYKEYPHNENTIANIVSEKAMELLKKIGITPNASMIGTIYGAISNAISAISSKQKSVVIKMPWDL